MLVNIFVKAAGEFEIYRDTNGVYVELFSLKF